LVVADGKRSSRPKLGAVYLERDDRAILEKHLCVHASIHGDRDTR
jgi:hypothetical protein